MIISFSQPVADARSFVPDPTDRIPRPYGTTASVGTNFLRHTGRLRARKSLPGDLDGEQYFCAASRAVRLPARIDRDPRSNTAVRCVYRRMFYNGDPIARFDIGFLVRSTIGRGWKDADDAIATAEALLSARVKIRLADKPPELRRAGNALAHHLLVATTRQKRMVNGPAPPGWWCRAGFPAAFVDYAKGELPPPPRTRQIAVRVPGVTLRYGPLLFPDGDVVPVWFIERDGNAASAAALLRRHLVRVHAHRETLRSLLYVINTKLITIQRGSDESEEIQRFLARAQSMILSTGKDVPLDQKQLLDEAYSYELLFSAEPDRNALVDDLTSIRGNIRRKTAEALIASHVGTIENINIGDTVQDNRKQVTADQIGAINMGSGTQYATITGSFNKGQASGATDEVKAALKALNDQIQALVAKLPPDQAEQVASDYAHLTEEATKPKPRKNFLETIGSGIIETAKTVGELAAPVAGAIHAVMAVLPLL